MTIGIVPNLAKNNVLEILQRLVLKLAEFKFNILIQESTELPDDFRDGIRGFTDFVNYSEFYSQSEIVFTLGGDGTMLSTAFESRNYDVPLVGINLGKLGFLAEINLDNIGKFIDDIKKGKTIIEERITLEAFCTECPLTKMFAVNDIVIDKGMWPKMIEITIKVDDEYVSTFSADGVIVATPTGSTGYSLSTGGPIVFPKAKSIIISPVAPHTLTMRPLVLSCEQKINITVNSQNKSVQVNCDGQRVNQFRSPASLQIGKSSRPMRLLHSKDNSYFSILREKLFWGLDVRQNS
ncbi:MAG: NAD(+) kinase [Ignavibacteria bacterium]|nr:NAD(+) kinase [Ignavibacteria bacterium]